MSHITFKTGKPHQEKAAVWARHRLGDQGGRCFSSPDDQDGVLFADSVGLGKTWEALAAAALILCKANPQKGLRHVLILCPANLVTKWEDELAASSPFRQTLERWVRKLKHSAHAKAAKVVAETLAVVFPIRAARHVRTKRKHGRFHPHGGTYIISQNLFTRHAPGLAALRREEWDVVIADEAHNAAARKALTCFQKRPHTKLLLTATPFQLEPRQMHSLTRNLVKHGQKVLHRPEVEDYIEALRKVFESEAATGPTPNAVDEASETLRKLAARTIPRSTNRAYQMLRLDGTSLPLGGRLQSMSDQEVAQLLAKLREQAEAMRDLGFEKAYFEERLRLATSKEQTYVATKLRRFLAAKSPRLQALKSWARDAFRKDIERSLESGLPHKTIVFTSWVGGQKNGEASLLRERLEGAFRRALREVKRQNAEEWSNWWKTGEARFRELASQAKPQIADALQTLGADELTAVLSGKHRRFAGKVTRELDRKDDDIQTAKETAKEADFDPFTLRALRRRIGDMQTALSPCTSGQPLRAVERYTGDERRSARDRTATAFRDIGPPWVLVASNIGAEGIDLHTYTARIVHYDLEWNPAKMEQREGRGDRVGRRLRDKLEILYCLVPRTYDERMFHQLVARERWHGVLLGKPAQELADEQTEARLISTKAVAPMRLDLRPR